MSLDFRHHLLSHDTPGASLLRSRTFLHVVTTAQPSIDTIMHDRVRVGFPPVPTVVSSKARCGDRSVTPYGRLLRVSRREKTESRAPMGKCAPSSEIPP